MYLTELNTGNRFGEMCLTALSTIIISNERISLRRRGVYVVFAFNLFRICISVMFCGGFSLSIITCIFSSTLGYCYSTWCWSLSVSFCPALSFFYCITPLVSIKFVHIHSSCKNRKHNATPLTDQNSKRKKTHKHTQTEKRHKMTHEIQPQVQIDKSDFTEHLSCRLLKCLQHFVYLKH